MRPSSYTMQHLQQSNNMQPLAGELQGSLGGPTAYLGVSTLAVVGVALMYMDVLDTKQFAPLAGAFLAGHFFGGTVLSV